MKLLVLKETKKDDTRIALVPAITKKLQDLYDLEILVETDAGAACHFSDADFVEIGASICKRDEGLQDADIVVGINPLHAKDAQKLKASALVVSHMFVSQNKELIAQLINNKNSALALEAIPRTTRAQSMDVLSSQATAAGYEAVLEAASLYTGFFPMLSTAAGSIKPAKMVVIGAGVAGLQAISMGKRLGAMVEAYDIRPAAKEQILSLGGKMIETGVNAEGQGGYARELTQEEKDQQQAVLAKHIAAANIVVTTAAIPGRPSPKIISKQMLEAMKPGSVVVDLASEGGGNCELTKAGKKVVHNGVTISGRLALAAGVATNASEMFAKNLQNLLAICFVDKKLTLSLEDDIIAASLIVNQGEAQEKIVSEIGG